MATDESSERFVGRHGEIESLSRLIDAARQGRGAVLMVRGEPGVGKTALVDRVVKTVSGVRVLRAAGVESEMELPFAVLQQLCGPVLDRLGTLPEPQRAALETVFGLSGGGPPDRFLVGLAVLSLVSSLGTEQPLLCVVDDAQWLDQASAETLAFVARRLLADPVGILFASREPLEVFAGLPELPVEGLRDDEARVLLATLIPFVLDPDVRETIVAETRGNPLALRELPRGHSPAELAGGFALPGSVPVSARIEASYRRRFEGLPAPTRGLLLVAAAEPMGNPVLIFKAAQGIGIASTAAGPAESEDLVEIGTRLIFRHPLVRSSVYRGASPAERRRAHRALAEATDPEADPDRRAWHLAQAASGPDEKVAAELERSASRAEARGGLAAAAAFLERAAALSIDAHSRALRALAAAQSKHLAGAHGAALGILAAAESGPLDERQRAQADLLRGEIAYAELRNNDAPGLLLRAARRFEPLDLRAARDTYLDALLAAHFAGRLAHADGSLREVAAAARQAPHPAEPSTACDLLLDGLATAVLDGYSAGAPILKRAVSEFRSARVTLGEELRWLWPAAHVAMALWDDESYELLAARHIELARQTGLLAVLPTALTTRIVAHAFCGELAAADQLIAELRTLCDAMGTPTPRYGPLFIAAWRGQEATTLAVIDAATGEVRARGEGAVLAFADYARAVLCNSLGRYQEALAASVAADAFDLEGFVIYTPVLAELIEAAVRAGEPERALDAMRRLAEMAQASDTEWAAGVRARSQALVSPDDAAEGLYREAIDRLDRTRVRPQLARARLLYGEWLRRQNRRTDARDQLRAAHEMLTGMGAQGFADRARRELLATGETVRRRAVDTVTQLSPQEAQIARLAVQGHTNPEIASQLFLSARTVEWHLRKVFTKLGIRSRRELRGALRHLAPVDLTA